MIIEKFAWHLVSGGMHYLKGKLCIDALWSYFAKIFALLRFHFQFAFLNTHTRSVARIFIPSFSSVLLLSGLFQYLLSGPPECHLLTSKPFNEIVLNFLSAASPSILVPLTPSAFFTVTTDSPLLCLFCLFLVLNFLNCLDFIKLFNVTPFL